MAYPWARSHYPYLLFNNTEHLQMLLKLTSLVRLFMRLKQGRLPGTKPKAQGSSGAERYPLLYLLFQLHDGHFDQVEVLAGGRAGARVHEVLRLHRETRGCKRGIQWFTAVPFTTQAGGSSMMSNTAKEKRTTYGRCMIRRQKENIGFLYGLRKMLSVERGHIRHAL